VVLGNHRLLRTENVDPVPAEEIMARLEGEGKTVMPLAADARLTGLIAVADMLKPETSEAVKALRDETVKVVILTGDNGRTAQAIARELTIQRVIAEVLPSDTAKVIADLQDQGKPSRWWATASTTHLRSPPPRSASQSGPVRTSRRRPVESCSCATWWRRSGFRARRCARSTEPVLGVHLQHGRHPGRRAGLFNPIIAAAAMALSSLSVIVNSALLKGMKLVRT
jgi:Cu+-exporting ATPase